MRVDVMTAGRTIREVATLATAAEAAGLHGIVITEGGRSAYLSATAAALAWCRTQGARIFRVHDVEVMRDVLVATEALMDGTPRRWHDVVM